MTEKDKKRKYLLFKKDDGRPDSLKPCAFFNSPEGCRNGSNCKFLHGSAPAQESTHDVSDVVSVASSVHEMVAPPSNSIKLDHKKRRTNDPGDDAPYPSFRVPSVAEDEIRQLKDQMSQQQKLFEEQLHLLTTKISQPQTLPQHLPLAPLALESRSMDPMIYTKLNSIQLIPAPNEVSASNNSGKKGKRKANGPISDTESSDDEKFLFGAVNQILETGRDAPTPAIHRTKSKDHKSASKSNSASKPVLTGPPPGMIDIHSLSAQQTNNPFLQNPPNNANSSSSNPYMFNGGNNNNNINSAPMKAPQPVQTNNNTHQSAANVFVPPAFQQPMPALALNNNIPPRSTPSPAPSYGSTTNTAVASGMMLPPHNSIGMPGIAEPSARKGGSNLTTLDVNSGVGSNGMMPSGMKSPQDSSKAANQRKNIFAKPKHGSGPSTAVNNNLPKLDFRTINYRHLPWEELVVKTQTHSRYRTDYNLNIDHTWIAARSSLKSEYPVIALDCEMCETEDPVTQQRESTMIRLSVVNGYNPDEVLIDTLVAPQLPITDLRTRIHGITEEQLINVKYTLRHVQAALLNIITEQTIIIGHSVYNDLKVLKLKHSKCVDTAYLFPMENEPENSRPGLKLVAEQLLGLNVPEPHDSIMDSRIALYAAAFALERGCLSIKRSAASFEQPSLLVHRIPEYVTEDHIKNMILAHSYIAPTSLSPLIRGESTSATDPVGKVTVYFLTQQHADLAFETIQGPVKPDKKNRPQKKIYLQGGGHVYVRK